MSKGNLGLDLCQRQLCDLTGKRQGNCSSWQEASGPRHRLGMPSQQGITLDASIPTLAHLYDGFELLA